MTDTDASAAWCSDALAKLLRELDIGFIALSPGSSFRGLHESLVNLLGNRDPEMLLCLHEEHAVAIAHGWAKVTGKPMGVLVHANVGLMHATMAIYNAFCDRVPMLVMGGVAPMDAGRRISPAHWYHSVLDQGALVRDYVKWDDQPFSLRGTLEALLRANQLTRTAPMAPCYVSIDQRMQEDPLPDRWSRATSPATRLQCPFDPTAMPCVALRKCSSARRTPVILAGRVSRDETAWTARVALAEALGADVDHRHEGRRGVSDRSSAASRRSDARVRRREKPGVDSRRRRHREPRLGRHGQPVRARVARRVRATEGHPDFGRPPRAQGLDARSHGLAGRRSRHPRRALRDRAVAARRDPQARRPRSGRAGREHGLQSGATRRGRANRSARRTRAPKTSRYGTWACASMPRGESAR